MAKNFDKIQTPEQFVQFISKMEEGCAPSCGYMEEIIQCAKKVLINNPLKNVILCGNG